MKNQLISEITRQMIPYLDNAQMEQLQNVLQHALWNVQITANEDGAQQPDKETNSELLEMFLSAKRVEGCSEKRCGIMKPQSGGCLLQLIPMLHTCRRMICEGIFLITSNKHSAAKAT